MASLPLAPLTGNGHWVLLKDAGTPHISMPFDARQMMLHPRLLEIGCFPAWHTPTVAYLFP